MTTSEVVARLDTWSTESFPHANHGTTGRLHVRALSGSVRRAYMFFGKPFPLDATIVSATLKLTLGSGWGGGPHTISVKRISEGWKQQGPNGLTWNNAPAVSGATATEAVSGGSDKDVVEIDVTTVIQAAASGSEYHGLRATVNTDGDKTLYSAESDDEPVLVVTWAVPGDPPADLVPSGGFAVSEEFPTVSWTFLDQAEISVEIDDDEDFPSPWQSGWVVQTEHSLDLADTDFPGMADEDVVYMRVMGRTDNGLESEWSDVVSFMRLTKGVLTITSPPDGVIEDTSPTIAHSFVGRTQESVRYVVEELRDGEFVLVYDSGQVATVSASFQIPDDLIVKSAVDYRITVYVWDTEDRVDNAVDPAWVSDSNTVNYVRDGSPDPVDSLILVETVGPQTIVEFHRTVRPDYFAVLVDDVYVASRLDPEDLETTMGGETYRYTFWTLRPNTDYTIEVEAVEVSGGDALNSEDNAILDLNFTLEQKWLMIPSEDVLIAFITPDDPSVTIGEDGETFFPANRRDPVRITSSVRGYEGTLSAALATYADVEASEWKDRLEYAKSLLGTVPMRMAWRDMNIEILLGEVSIVPTKKGWYEVAITFWQTDDFTFELVTPS